MGERIVFVADQVAHWNAGTERQMLLLGNELTRLGWQVPLYVLRPSTASHDGTWPDAVRVLDARKLLSITSWRRSLEIGRKEYESGVSVAHCFFNDSSILVPPTFHVAGIRCLISRRDMGYWYTTPGLMTLRAVRPFVAGVVANSRAVGENVCLREGYKQEDVQVIHNGLSSETVPISTATTEPVVIGLVANIRPVKRIEDAIRAYALVAREFPRSLIRIIGGGDRTALTVLASDYGIDNQVELLGPTNEPAREIAKFSVGLITSESEGLSNSIIEYMQAGIPVICTDTGGNPELVQHGVSGFLSPVGDDKALAGHMRTLLSDTELRRKQGRAGRAVIEAMCSTKRMVDAHIDLYRRVASQAKAVACHEVRS